MADEGVPVHRQVRSKRFVCIASLAVLPWAAVGLLAAVGAAIPAGAAAVKTAYTATCSTTFFGKVTLKLPLSISATVPLGVDPGHTLRVSGFQATVSISATLTTAFINVLHAASVSGTVTTLDVKATTATPATTNLGAPPLKFGPVTPVPKEPTNLSVPTTPTTLGPFKAGSGGTIALSIGTIKVNTVIHTTSNTTTHLPLVCKAPATPVPFAKVPVQTPVVTGEPPGQGDGRRCLPSALIVAGGTAPYTWSVVSGTYPKGLSLDPSTGAITGTPTTAGNSTFKVKVVDANKFTAVATVSITVQSAGTPGYQLVASDGGIFSYGGAKSSAPWAAST